MRYLKNLLFSYWLLCPLLAVLVLAGSLTDLPLLQRLDLPFYDQLIPLRDQPRNYKVVLFSVDQRSRALLGATISSRAQQARIVEKLARMGVKQLAVLAPLSFPGISADDRQLAGKLTLLKPVLAVEPQQNEKTAGLLPTTALVPEPHPLPAPQQLLLARQNPLADYRFSPLPASRFLPPAKPFSALPIGHLQFDADSDERIRRHPLLVPYAGKRFPSLPLRLVLQQAGIQPDSLQLPPAGLPGSLHIGRRIIPVDSDFQLILDLEGAGFPFQHYSVSELLSGKLDSIDLRDKLVLLDNALPYYAHRQLATRGPVSTGELAALATATLLTESPPVRPPWSWQLESLVLVYFLVLLLLLVPRLSIRAGLLTLALFLITWLLAAAASLVIYGYWFKVAPAAVLCFAGFILVRWVVTQRDIAQGLIDHQRQLALTYQEQGKFDQALEKFLQFAPQDKASKEMLYNLGLDFERKRMPHKALTAYRHLLASGRFRDTKGRIRQLLSEEQTPTANHRSDATLILTRHGEKPTLGRYRIEKELGQGAMGTVYLGVDPKINRQVAIKTLAYQQVDPSQLQMVKERFFREAEAAGRLSHPKIVTVYDVGEENDLAYLAMELLAGKDLSHFCQAKQRLSPLRTVQIVKQIAQALDYAHNQGVVHRDIKPANIIILDDGQIKVTDFGIARMVSSSQTETGIILGTPSYMSPEQVAGKKVDGRSDLFSLGIVMYELLSGEKPFQGDSMAALMYNISSGKYRPLNEICPKLPPECLAIVEKLLQKAVTRRFKSAGLLAAELDTLQQKLENG